MLTRTFSRLRQVDWRIFLGIIITALWIIAGVVYLSGAQISKTTIYDIPLENIGSFLEGAFAPLAFLHTGEALRAPPVYRVCFADMLRLFAIGTQMCVAYIAVVSSGRFYPLLDA